MSKPQLNAQQELLASQAAVWARENRTRIANEMTSLDLFPGEEAPVSLFMAGAPGAGKTEASKALVAELGGFLRIDPDDLRLLLPGYTGNNAALFQEAVTRIVERIVDKAFRQKQSFLLDGTLSNYGVAERNVQRCLDAGRSVLIIFVHQEPSQAWEFVRAREAAEGRHIPPERFVEQFFASRSTVNDLKRKFQKQVAVDVIHKNIDGSSRKYYANVRDVDHVTPVGQTREEVEKIVNCK